MEFYWTVRKKKNFPFATAWMKLENIMLSEMSHSEKDKYHTISLICGIQWTNWTNEQVKTYLLIESRISCWRGGKGVEGLSKKEKGLTNMDNSVVIARGGI